MINGVRVRCSTAAPFAHKPRAGLQRNRPCGLLRVACLRVEVQAFQLAHDRFGEAAERPLLEFVGDPTHQEITGQPHGRRRPMQPPPLAAQFEDRRGGKPRQRLRDINRRLGHVGDRDASRCGNGGRRLPLSKWSARNQASSSPCPPKTRARCAAASLLPASSLRC